MALAIMCQRSRRRHYAEVARDGSGLPSRANKTSNEWWAVAAANGVLGLYGILRRVREPSGCGWIFIRLRIV
jgi:hypothetical protein